MQAYTWAQDLATHGDLLFLATTTQSGIQFRGIITGQELIDPDTGMRDPREHAVLEVNRADCPAALLDYSQVTTEWRVTGVGEWLLVGREDNPVDNVIRFMLRKWIPGLDT